MSRGLFDYMVEDLSADEGTEYKVYLDSLGKPTVGRGHLVKPEDNLKVGDEIDTPTEQKFFATDIRTSVNAARRAIPDLDRRPIDFQRGVTNMMFQLGPDAPKKFPKAFTHLKAGNIEEGIRELSLNKAGDGPSLWAQQTPNRFASTTDKLRQSIGAVASPPTTGGEDTHVYQPPSNVAAQKKIADNVPESWVTRRGDELEMGVKALGSGMLSTASLVTRWADLGFDTTDPAADWLEKQADSIRQSVPQWIQDDIHKKVFKRDDNGDWEFDMPSLRAVTNLVLESVGPGGFIGIGGKVAAKAAAKKLPKLFEKAPRLAPAAAYGGVNAAYIASDSYQNAYESTYGQAIAEGQSEDTAKAEAERVGQMAALIAGPLSLATGTVGGLAMRGSGLASRIAKGALLGSASEAVEEPGQYVAEQLAMERPVDPMEVASRAVLGALAAGPMEGAMAGMLGEEIPANVDPDAITGGEALIDAVVGDVAAPSDDTTPGIDPMPDVEEVINEPVLDPDLPVDAEIVTNEPVLEPDPVADPVADQAEKVVTKPVIEGEPAPAPKAEPVEEVVTKPVAEPAQTPVEEVVNEPVVEPDPLPVDPEAELNAEMRATAEEKASKFKGKALKAELDAREIKGEKTADARRAQLAEALLAEEQARLDEVLKPRPPLTAAIAPVAVDPLVLAAEQAEQAKLDEAELAKEQAQYDKAVEKINSMKKPALKEAAKSVNIDHKQGVQALKAQLIDVLGGRPSTKPESAPVTPAETTSPSPAQPEVAEAGTTGPTVREKLVPVTSPIPLKDLRKNWGKDWVGRGKGQKSSGAYRIHVGGKVYTLWKPTHSAEGKGKVGTYRYREGEPKDFNPTDETLNAGWTGATKLKDAEAVVVAEAQRLHAKEVRANIKAEKRAGPPDEAEQARMDEAADIAERVIREDLTGDELMDAAVEVLDIGSATATEAGRMSVLDAWEDIKEQFEKQVGSGGLNLTDQARRHIARKAQGEAQAEEMAAQEVRYESNSKYNEEQKQLRDRKNEFEEKTLEAERKRGLSAKTLWYLFRRKFTGKTYTDEQFEETMSLEIEELNDLSFMEALQRFRRGEVLRRTTQLVDQSRFLIEMQNILKSILPVGGFSENMNIRDLRDAEAPIVSEKTQAFGREVEDKYTQRLVAEKVSHEDMTLFAGAVQALWRNAFLARKVVEKAERKMIKAEAMARDAEAIAQAEADAAVGQPANSDEVRRASRAKVDAREARKVADQAIDERRKVAPNPALSGISNKMARESIEKVAPTPEQKTQLTEIFKDHWYKVAQMQRDTYREYGLMPASRVDMWEAPYPADPLNLPDKNDPDLHEKVRAGFHGTYVPLQHQEVDYNAEQVEANVRQQALAGIGDVAGDEVMATSGQGLRTQMPMFIWAQMQENLFTSYARGEATKSLRQLGKVVRQHKNRLLWSTLAETDKEFEAAMQEAELDALGMPIETTYRDDLKGHGGDENVPGAQFRKDIGVTDFRPDKFLPIRYKMEDGRQAMILIHSSQLEAVFNGETGLGGMPTMYAGKVSKWISQTNTAWSVGFLSVQVPRDFAGAKALLPANVAKHVRLRDYSSTIKMYWDVTENNPVPANASAKYKELRKIVEEEYRPHGVHTEFFRKAQLADHMNTLKESYRRAEKSGSKADIKTMLLAIPRALEAANTVMENVPRILAYAGARKEGYSIHGARKLARELNVNFATAGARGTQLNAWYPFYKATVSGNAILYRAFKKSPRFRKYVYSYAAMGLANGMVQSVLSGEDDDGRSRYFNLPQHIRDRNFVFFYPDSEEYIKIPIPYGINAAVAMGDSLAEVFMSPEPADTTAAVSRSINAVMNTFNPIASTTLGRSLVPAVGEPIYDIMNNTNFFGSPINPEQGFGQVGGLTDAFNVRDPDKRTPATYVAQALAWATGGEEYREGGVDVSPGTLQYLWDFGLGSAGASVRRTFEALTAGSMHDAGVKAPVIRRYFGTMSDFHHKSRYYDMREDLYSIQNQRKVVQAGRRDNPERYADFMQEYGDYWSRGVMGKFDASERRLRKLIRKKNEIRKRAGKSVSQQRAMGRYADQIDDTVVRFNSYYYNRMVRGDMNR